MSKWKCEICNNIFEIKTNPNVPHGKPQCPNCNEERQIKIYES